jgi:hypothetical protein
MTFLEMKTEAELLYESINSSNSPGFTNSEWGQLFTVAQRRIVLNILREGINKNTFNQLAIEKLVKSDSYLNFVAESHFHNSNDTDTQKINVAIKPFNIKFFWILDEYVSTVASNNIPIKRITYDFYRINKDNPFRIPDVNEGFWMLQYDNAPVFITDGSVVTGYYIIGVEHPDNYPIVSGVTYGLAATEASCLNVGVHHKIVEEAVTLARMSISDTQGYQLSMAEFAKNN